MYKKPIECQKYWVKKTNSSHHIISKTPHTQNKERILKAVREKGQVIYKGRPIRITPDFSTETLKARKSWTGVIQTIRDYRCQPRLLCQQNSQSPLMGKTRYSMTKPNLNNTFY